MKYYVVSDVHGFYTELKEALERAGFFTETEPCKLVVCGDVLDRGKEACLLVDFLIDLLNEDKLVYVLGNHEELLVQCLQEISRGGIFEIACGMSHHYRNGTWDTLIQLSGMKEAEALSAAGTLVASVKNSPFYKTLLPKAKDYFETPSYIFIHGWIPCKTSGQYPRYAYAYNPNWREAGRDDWYRARWFNGMEFACKRGIKEKEKIIICGHFHASYGHALFEGRGVDFGKNADYTPFYADGIIAIDACTAVSKFVNCIVIED